MTDPKQTKDAQVMASYAGYEYQILATVWIGLNLTLSGRAEAIVIEPPSDEDVAAVLNVDPESAISGASAGTLQIQIKLRNGNVWNRSSFASLIEDRTQKSDSPGPKPRMRAVSYLRANPSHKYILLTNADVDGGLNPFAVSTLQETSKAIRLPNKHKDEPALASRIGILQNLTEEVLRARIHRILQGDCHVTGNILDPCVITMMNEVRDRMLGRKAKRFTTEGLKEIIRHHGGSFQAARPPVFPINMGKIRDAIDRRHALLLVGPAGTGKTTLVNHLLEILETGNPPAQRLTVKGRGDIQLVRDALKDPNDHVFFFEDPWGQDGSLHPDAGLYTSEIPKLLSEARAGKRFLVTSRIGVFKIVSDGLETLNPFTIELHPTDYDHEARKEIFQRQINDWEKSCLGYARAIQKEALKELETPYAIRMFCDLLKEKLHEGSTLRQINIRELAAKSNTGTFGKVLTERITAGGDDFLRSSISIWAYVTTSRDLISAEAARNLYNVLVAGGMANAPDVEEVFNELANAHWFQPRSNGYTTTPSVLEALATFEDRKRLIFKSTIETLVRGWSIQGNQESALKCIQATKGGGLLVPDDVKETFDQYLIRRALTDEGYRFGSSFNDLAHFSRSEIPAALLTRSLAIHKIRKKNGSLGHFGQRPPQWKIPDLDASSLKIIEANADAEMIAKKFVFDYLPQNISYSWFGSPYEAKDLVTFLRRMEWPILDWFWEAFDTAVSRTSDSTTFLMECVCLIEPAKIEDVFNVCLKAFSKIHEETTTIDDESYRHLVQGEEDAVPDGYYEADAERWFSANKDLTHALKLLKEHQGFQWVPVHEKAELLLSPWADIIQRETSPDEHSALVQLADNLNIPEPALKVLERQPNESHSEWVCNVFLTVRTKIETSLQCVLLEYERFPSFLSILESKCTSAKLENRLLTSLLLAELCPDLVGLENPSRRTRLNETSASPNLVSIFNIIVPREYFSMLRKCCSAHLGVEAIPDEQFSVDEYGPLLLELANIWPQAYGISALDVYIHFGGTREHHLSAFLFAEDSQIRSRAIGLCNDRHWLLKNGLSDVDWRCRVTAMNTLAEEATPAEITLILKLADDPSAYVREALAELIGNFAWQDGIPTLTKLLFDTREYGERQGQDDFRIYSVARTACTSLRNLSPLPIKSLKMIQDFLGRCELSSMDTTVHGRLFRILGLHVKKDICDFCAEYFSRTWIQSKWRENDGHKLVVECLHVLITCISQQPDFALNLNLEEVKNVAGWDEEVPWLAKPAQVLLGVADHENYDWIKELAASDGFDIWGARLLLCLSCELWLQRPEPLMQLIPAQDPCLKVLECVRAPKEHTIFSSFRETHPEAADWVEIVAKDVNSNKYDLWALGRVFQSVCDHNLPTKLPYCFAWRDEK